MPDPKFIVIEGQDALRLWDGSECPVGRIDGYCSLAVIGRDGDSILANLWGKVVAIDPSMVLDKE